ncbi:MAG TPA: hypothetical protein VN253_14400 [Kofleriaceae bacterium]|nr:hypothetical protein [Kofleriaceae bacterium]
MRAKVRWPIVALALAAGAAFAVSVQAGRWWSVGGFEIGPSGSYRCFSGECKTTGLGWIGGSERWMRTGTGAWTAGLISMLLLIAVAAAAAAGRAPRLLAKTALVSIATAAVTGALFVVEFPGVQGASADRGMWLFVAAIVLGAAACIAVLRASRASR